MDGRRWTFSVDADPVLGEPRRRLLVRSGSGSPTATFGDATLEVRLVSPEVTLEALTLLAVAGLLGAFVTSLGPAVPAASGMPGWWSPRPMTMNELEQDLWGTLVSGVDFSRGVFQSDQDLAADWVSTLLVRLDASGASRHFRADDLFVAGGSRMISWFILAPERVALVCLAGTD